MAGRWTCEKNLNPKHLMNQTCDGLVFLLNWRKFQNKRKIKVMFAMPITFQVLVKVGIHGYPAHKALKNRSLFVNKWAISLFFLIRIFWAINNIVMPFIGFLHTAQLRPAVVSLLCVFLPFGIWVAVNTKWNWNSNLWPERIIVMPQIRDWY